MERWDQKRYEEEKRNFIRRRVHLAPLWSQFTLVFGISWGAAWFCSWYLLRYVAQHHAWAYSLPLRYAIAFAFAYACFFIAVRVWIEVARRKPEQQHDTLASDLGNIAGNLPADGEGCALAAALALIGFIAGGLFLAVGGAPMLLEAAFEAAFAGIVVMRPISGDLILGDWKLRLLEHTWKKALLGLVLLITLAAWLQHRAPAATTLAQAFRSAGQQPPTPRN